jgi:hypothetical protein
MVAEILMDPWFETAAAFSLRDMAKVMHEQFAVAPGISPNNNRIAQTYTTRVVGDYAGVPRGFSQLAILGARESDQLPALLFWNNPAPGETRIGHVPRT